MGRLTETLPRRYREELEKGQVFAEELDPELQALSAEASRELRVSHAGVVLVRGEVAFLRAFHGPSPISRSGARSMSLCQFVVRDGVYFEVNDAAHDERIPDGAFETDGVASYLGAPIVLDGKTVGSMCVLDNEPRLFDDRERGILHRIAAKASRRLAMLATEPRELERSLHDRAVRPAFGEIRNRLQPVLGNISAMQVMMEELVSLRKQKHACTNMAELLFIRTQIDEVICDLCTVLDDISGDTGVLHRAILAIERASLMSEGSCSIHDVIGPATTLAHHRTKLVEGVSWSGMCRDQLDVPRSVAVNALAAALAGIAEHIPRGAAHGITGTITSADDLAVVELRADVPAAAIGELASQLAVLIGDRSRVRVHDKALQLGFATVQLS
jgi:hypothetical protein